MRYSTTLAALLLATSAVEAQVTRVVPAGAAQRDADGSAFWAFSPFAARRQLLIDASVLGSQKQRIAAIWLRRNNARRGEVHEAGALLVDIYVSTATRPAADASETFAVNAGRDRRLLYSGLGRLPAADGPPATWPAPAPWKSPEALRLPFRAPFDHDGRAPLCLEVITRTLSSSSSPWWPIDAVVAAPTGVERRVGVSCIPDMGGASAGAEASTLAVGSSAVFFLRGDGEDLDVKTGVALLGMRNFELDLTRLGARGCTLRVAYDWLMPYTLQENDATEWMEARVQVRVPNMPSMIGTSVYAQFLSFAREFNALGIVTSNAVEARIGRDPLPGTAGSKRPLRAPLEAVCSRVVARFSASRRRRSERRARSASVREARFAHE